MDGQQIAALAVVGIAAGAVGRRMFGQIAGFWTTNKSAGCGGCDGCGSSKTTVSTTEAKPSTPRLVQLSTRPPVRVKRPSSDDV